MRASASQPEIYSIAAHRGFADALVAGLVPRYAEEDFGLARLTLLLPSSRARRTVTEAFTRHFGNIGAEGMLLPRMAVVGDLDLDEALGSLLDPLGAPEIPPAVDPTRRWLALAALLEEEFGKDAPEGAARLRMARDVAAAMDRLLVEEIRPEELTGDAVLDLLGDLAEHWQVSLRIFARMQARWLATLGEWGRVDSATRRNLLFDHARKAWEAEPPQTPLVAAGVTSASPALARMLRTIAFLPRGAVILPDFDLTMPDDVWDELGRAGNAPEPGDTPFAKGDAITHPQYHLKLLLNRMGIAREEVRAWHRRGDAAGPPARSHAIASLFLPPEASRVWADLPADRRRLSGVTVMESANPEEEAQAIALLVREALEVPEKRVAVITPDRGLARRVVQHLRRWHIEADDSAGQPLSQTAAGRALLLLAETMAEDAAPVALMALLSHPLAKGSMERGAWLSRVRRLERGLRGPRPRGGLEPLRALVEKQSKDDRDGGYRAWWAEVEAMLEPLLAPTRDDANQSLAEMVNLLAAQVESLCGTEVWAKEDGRALAAFVEDLRLHAAEAGTLLDPRDLAAVLQDGMEPIAVRPPYGGHSRVAIYGLLESRMSRADLMICGGLNEGVWPGGASLDPLLAPPVLRALGVPGGDFRIGLSAHDLAGALGAPEVLLSRAMRDESGPTIPSRFLLRVKALQNDQRSEIARQQPVEWARAIDAPTEDARETYPRPQPMPDAAQRDVPIAVTALDRLLGDPYQFYASSILGLRALDPLDAEPTAAWQGSLAHAILEQWHKERASDPAARLAPVAERVLTQMDAHPLTRGLWKPRLMAALEWVEDAIRAEPDRQVIAVERKGEMIVDGVRIHGRADRIDRLEDGSLAIVDYKTGSPPSAKMVEAGFALQLGLIGMITERGGFEGVSGEAKTFEYWSLAKNRDGEFGYTDTPLKVGRKRSGIEPDAFLPTTAQFLDRAISDFIKGSEPFTARLNPDFPAYADYDQLMRLDEWLPRLDGDGA
ncbi:double-strand break repair protein AddB [Altererythrobacter sp. HHU K3-1]|uniref:Double-strand break repair protein AddB n=1 Tax=Qipengyuania atrilutea TaxID=2744473 RepID=A0A850H2V3_9SPHN|nr:double-strand break repair protein AddB [Actirhodobacter atriluteus]